ncbi:hypothetical protein [Glutamicibacter arilaitensis]|uniref:hypothetical protein n=1 Tax=Glutamicibacter arilaitensis TaxID=256701 RepID=UPI003F9381B5
MGYDMRIRGTIDTDEARARRAASAQREAFWQAHQAALSSPAHADHERLRAEYEDHWGKVSAIPDPSYFRLNIGGMGLYMQTMLELGMAHASAAPKIEWPSYPDDEDDAEAMDAFWALKDERTGQHLTTDPTIPSHKLYGTNDGWHVTPAEIRAALNAWDSRPSSETVNEITQTEYWGKWIDYLRLAADSGGFRVH